MTFFLPKLFKIAWVFVSPGITQGDVVFKSLDEWVEISGLVILVDYYYYWIHVCQQY